MPPAERLRLRELGYELGQFPTGPRNAIVDVAEVRVGHVTLVQDLPGGRAVRTGVTAVLPHGRDPYREKLFAACHVVNGFGKTIGLVQLQELGLLESPILLTNTLSVPAVAQGALERAVRAHPTIGIDAPSVNVVVGECNDGYLNDIRGFHVTAAHADAAIEGASATNVEEGSVGAGTGMSCLGYKGGIGTSSRRSGEGDLLGALVVANFGGRRAAAGSIMIVLATDAPVNERQLERIARRAGFGIARAGGYAAHGSGDIAIAFSTAQTVSARGEPTLALTLLRDDGERYDDLLAMTPELIHEAIVNALCKADAMTGRDGNRREAFPWEETGALARLGVT